MNYIICVIAAMSLAMPVSAQDMPQGNPQNQERMGQRPQGGPQGYGFRGGQGARQRMTPEQIAKIRVDYMQKELVLTEKQYKKVFTLTLNEIEYRQALQQEAFGSMGQYGGQRGEGMGRPEGGASGEASQPRQRPEGMGQQGGAQRPEGTGQWQGRPEGQHPGGQGYQGRRGGFQPVQLPESYVKKQDKKLQKILTPEQYAKWQEIKDKPFMGGRSGMGRGMRPGMGPVHDPKAPQGTLPADQK